MVFFFCNGPVAPVASVSPAAMRTESDKSFDLEKFIGKLWMGIMASVLILLAAAIALYVYCAVKHLQPFLFLIQYCS